MQFILHASLRDQPYATMGVLNVVNIKTNDIYKCHYMWEVYLAVKTHILSLEFVSYFPIFPSVDTDERLVLSDSMNFHFLNLPWSLEFLSIYLLQT